MKQSGTVLSGNPFCYSDTNKRYHTLAYANKRQGVTVYKAVIDAGFSCPNMDDRRGRGGCIYCAHGGGYFTAAPLSVAEQIRRELLRIRRQHPQAQAIAYFQAYTNTYAPVERLRILYEEALAEEGIVGLSIATRADALPPEVVAYLATLRQQTRLTVELGLQTVHDQTAALIQRGHDFGQFRQAYRALKQQGIRVVVHLINGLPGENLQMMVQSARVVAALRPDGLKLHLLHVLQDTLLAEWYRQGCYQPLTLAEYVEIVIRQLELLPPETIIERITGDGDKAVLVA
ncbi:MAG: TIGR01212 family radical SAM protein, partial [Clostridiales bacterium]